MELFRDVSIHCQGLRAKEAVLDCPSEVFMRLKVNVWAKSSFM